jgi:hypothetical protein
MHFVHFGDILLALPTKPRSYQGKGIVFRFIIIEYGILAPR